MPHPPPTDSPTGYVPTIVTITTHNWRGLWTLYYKEVQRFASVGAQTILSPILTMAMFIIIFNVTVRRAVDIGIDYYDFLIPGLIMMAMIQNGFANSSSSILHSKIMGSFVDILMAPLSPGEITMAYLLGALTRALIVGGVALILFVPFMEHSVWHIGIGLFYAVIGSLIMAALGLIGGIWARKFDQMATITNFIVMPMTFLSGTFYSVRQLPEPWNIISTFNPFHYLIDGFRYALTGYHDTNIILGMTITAAAAITLSLISWRMIATGHRLRS